MSSMSDIREGMQVYSADEALVGTVESLRGGMLLVSGQQIPGDAIARVARGRIYLKAMGTRMSAQSRQQTAGEIHVPVAEERLSVEKRAAELGEVRLHKTVTEEQQTVPVELQREEVHVERRDVADRPAQAGDHLFQEGTIRVPVRGEEAVVSKEAVVTGEVVIGKEQLVERQQVADTVRKEQVAVDEQGQQGRARVSGPASGTTGGTLSGAPTGSGRAGGQMVAAAQVQPGMEVAGADHTGVGRVKEVRQGDFHLDRPMERDLYVPFSAIREVTGGRVVLDVPAQQVASMGWPETPLL